MKKDLYENTYLDKNHFSFGQNWQSFLKKMSPHKLEEAKLSLQKFLNVDTLEGKTFIDIGCGSGLFSLAAYHLGATKVVSVDIDKSSVSCAEYLHAKEGSPQNWQIITGSALDVHFLQTLGQYDIVYSWGVLHHTGSMYTALANVASLVSSEGVFYVALYNDNQHLLEGSSSFWLKAKQLYNKCPWIIKKFFDGVYVIYYLLGLLLNGINPINYIKNYDSLRGMTFYIDVKDWLGGLPYEYASPEKIVSFFSDFECVRQNPARSIGCNEFLFRKKN